MLEKSKKDKDFDIIIKTKGIEKMLFTDVYSSNLIV
jgi:hypothetical protein